MHLKQQYNNISIFMVDGTTEKTTTQITGGKIAGLVNFNCICTRGC